MGHIQELTKAVEHMHGCKARHLHSAPVEETFQGRTVWEGVVQAFELSGHPNAQRCYAWKHWQDDKGRQSRIVAVLEVLPIDSSVAAVKAAIVADVKKNRAN